MNQQGNLQKDQPIRSILGYFACVNAENASIGIGPVTSIPAFIMRMELAFSQYSLDTCTTDACCTS